MILKETLLLSLLPQRRVMGIESRNSASYAGQSNQCYAASLCGLKSRGEVALKLWKFTLGR